MKKTVGLKVFNTGRTSFEEFFLQAVKKQKIEYDGD